MLNTKINIIVSFITSGVILVGIYCLNSIYVFVDGLGIGTLIAGILFLSSSVGIGVIEHIKNIITVSYTHLTLPTKRIV